MKYSKYPRIYIDVQLLTGKIIPLDKDQLNYLKTVLRLKDGFKLRVFNENDGEYFANLLIKNLECNLKLLEKFRDIIVPRYEVTLLVPLIKLDRFELMCDMVTQLGIVSIIPIITERVQRRELNFDRLNKIVKEATRQSERFISPRVSHQIYLEDIEFGDYNIILFANEMEQNQSSLEFDNVQKIAILVGPEGGFTDYEIRTILSKCNVVSMSLGDSVLRTETAVISMLSLINYM